MNRTDDGGRASKTAHLVWLAVFAGLLLTLIGVRFLVVPAGAVRTFGLPGTDASASGALEAVIAFRDIWLGVLLVAFAALGEWRAAGLWLILAVGVCWADAVLVATSGGHWAAVGFHVGSGIFCLVLGRAALLAARRGGPGT
ncbi:MAG: DUF4267 domain-containing protein [Hyphomicrobiaceae bacterium]|nr:DUF4267 domain-containing protein [Hyphomicrobiaceae bacterium]